MSPKWQVWAKFVQTHWSGWSVTVRSFLLPASDPVLWLSAVDLHLKSFCNNPLLGLSALKSEVSGFKEKSWRLEADGVWTHTEAVFSTCSGWDYVVYVYKRTDLGCGGGIVDPSGSSGGSRIHVNSVSVYKTLGDWGKQGRMFQYCVCTTVKLSKDHYDMQAVKGRKVAEEGGGQLPFDA